MISLKKKRIDQICNFFEVAYFKTFNVDECWLFFFFKKAGNFPSRLSIEGIPLNVECISTCN